MRLKTIILAILIAWLAAAAEPRPLVLRCTEVEPCRPRLAIDFCRALCANCESCPNPTEIAGGTVGCPRPPRRAYCLGSDGALGWCQDRLGCSGCPAAGNMGGVVTLAIDGGGGVGGKGAAVDEGDNPFAAALARAGAVDPSPPATQGSGSAAFSPAGPGATTNKALRPTHPVDLLMSVERGKPNTGGVQRIEVMLPRSSSGLLVIADRESGRLFLAVRPLERDRAYLGELIATGGFVSFHSGVAGGRWDRISFRAVAVLPPLTADQVLAGRMAMLEARVLMRRHFDGGALPNEVEMADIAEAAAGLWQAGSAGAIPWRTRDWPTEVPK